MAPPVPGSEAASSATGAPLATSSVAVNPGLYREARERPPRPVLASAARRASAHVARIGCADRPRARARPDDPRTVHRRLRDAGKAHLRQLVAHQRRVLGRPLVARLLARAPGFGAGPGRDRSPLRALDPALRDVRLRRAGALPPRLPLVRRPRHGPARRGPSRDRRRLVRRLGRTLVAGRHGAGRRRHRRSALRPRPPGRAARGRHRPAAAHGHVLRRRGPASGRIRSTAASSRPRRRTPASSTARRTPSAHGSAVAAASGKGCPSGRLRRSPLSRARTGRTSSSS